MNTALLISLSSIFGALLFALAGWFFARGLYEKKRARIEAAEHTRNATAEARERSVPDHADNASIQRFVADVVRAPSVSAAAVTDELGFLVAGSGEHAEALAAFGAYLTEAGARASGLLPIHEVRKVSIHDTAGVTLTARTIASAPNELVLVTLNEEGRSL